DVTLSESAGFLMPITLKLKLSDNSSLIDRLKDKGVAIATQGGLGNIYHTIDPTDAASWTRVRGGADFDADSASILTNLLTDISSGSPFVGTRPDVGPIDYGEVTP
ncbi:MAG: hypothetical protein ACN4E2_03410, partial [Nitrospinota bacterium]